MVASHGLPPMGDIVVVGIEEGGLGVEGVEGKGW